MDRNTSSTNLTSIALNSTALTKEQGQGSVNQDGYPFLSYFIGGVTALAILFFLLFLSAGVATLLRELKKRKNNKKLQVHRENNDLFV